MDFRLLNYFSVLCEEMNYGRAAKRLYITQPTLSQQIKLLEEKLDCSLITKNGNKFTLTEAGQILQVQAYKLLKASQETELMITQAAQREPHKITIYSSGSHFFTDILVNYTKKHPQTTFKIDECSSRNVVRHITEGHADFGLVYLPMIEATGNLAVEELLEDTFFIVVNKKHPLSQKNQLSLKELEQQALILVKPSLAIREIIHTVAQQQTISLTPTFEFPNYIPCLDLVRHNLGVTILPWSFLQFHSLEKVHLVAITEKLPKATLAFIHRKEKAFTSHQRNFITEIRQSFHSST